MKLAAASLDDVEWYGRILHKPQPRASLTFHTPEFYFNCPILCRWVRLNTKLDTAAGTALPTHSCLSKEMGKHTHARIASSLPSAVVNERGCCCQVSCVFETAAERTHCALATQSGTTAARLPGTTGSIWHTDEFTHTHIHTHTLKDCGPKSQAGFKCSVKLKNLVLIEVLTHNVSEKKTSFILRTRYEICNI